MMVSMKSTDWQTVLVDLLNTTPVVAGAPTDLLADDGAARVWLRAHGGDGHEDLTGIRAVRKDLQGVVRGEVAFDVLNRHIASVRRKPRIGAEGVDWAFEGPVDWPARVVLAWGDAQNELPGRLRPCANDECHLFLLDRSRGGTGRWCSMSSCGNRMKARRHYGRATGKPGV
jgi:CGNR zinc finger protein/putative stress-induced transcription regulator